MNSSKVQNAFSVMFNPLRQLSKPQIERMINNANHGADSRLQLIFS